MSSEDIAIRVTNLSKCYEIYGSPRDRLKQFVLPRFQRLAGLRTSQYFREFWALKEVCLEVRRGETVGIIGRNGSGKSTLLQMICGTLTPTTGSVETRGRVAALLELGSGFNPEYTGRENVYMNAAVLGFRREEVESRFDDIAAFADIGDFIDRPVKTYSSGMHLRLAFAVIAHADASILVIDEALAVGDVFFSQKCMRFLRKFMEEGTVLFVSHDIGAVKSLCHRVMWLADGKAAGEGSPKDICDRYLHAIYETHEGKPILKGGQHDSSHDMCSSFKDPRLDFIDTTTLRNDIRLFTFDPNSASFGKGGAEIIAVNLIDREGVPVRSVVGGHDVILAIRARAYEPLDAVIVGFHVKDRLGQALFGDNTYLTYIDNPMKCKAGKQLQAEFRFQMPIMPVGDYSIDVAIANGTQAEHVQCHWIYDALVFKSESSSVATGLVGIPMYDIRITLFH